MGSTLDLCSNPDPQPTCRILQQIRLHLRAKLLRKRRPCPTGSRTVPGFTQNPKGPSMGEAVRMARDNVSTTAYQGFGYLIPGLKV